MRHRWGSLAVLVATALCLAACGARVGPYLGAVAGGVDAGTGVSASGAPNSKATGSTVSGTGSGTPGAASATLGADGAGSSGFSGTGSASASGSGATPASGATSGGPTHTTLSPQSFSFSPQAEAEACRGTQGNTASAPGVTPTTITFGNVSGLTGPLSNNFTQGAQAVTALFKAVDAAGGICGRQLALTVQDDGQNSSTNASDTEDLIPKVFGFAGSLSDADNGGVPAIEAAKVPDFGFAINCDRSAEPTYWSAAGGSCATLDGQPAINDSSFVLAKQYGYFPKSMAFLAYSIAISAQAAQQFAAVYQKLGGTVCYSNYSVSEATASLDSEVYQMEQDHCDGVYTTFDVTGNAKLLQAMAQQSYHVLWAGTTLDGYTPAQITVAGQSAAQGFRVDIPSLPLNSSNPAIQLYLSQLSTYEPGQEPSEFGFLSWESAQLAIYALIDAGHDPTRASVNSIMSGVTNWTGGGALGPYTPNTHGVAACDVNLAVVGSQFVQKAPSSGLWCTGQLVPA